jgi:hypothetical protein
MMKLDKRILLGSTNAKTLNVLTRKLKDKITTRDNVIKRILLISKDGKRPKISTSKLISK